MEEPKLATGVLDRRQSDIVEDPELNGATAMHHKRASRSLKELCLCKEL
jgi:hypothetical protein